MIDWERFKLDPRAGVWGEAIRAFDWGTLTDWTHFVDDMTINGMLLCKVHHIGKDEGMLALLFPSWIAQKYGKEGYQFSAAEVIHHAV